MWEQIKSFFGHGRPDSVRMGTSVVTVTATVVVAVGASVAAIVTALANFPVHAVVVVAMLLLVVVIFLLGTWRFADKHPDLAALGGSSWAKYQTQMKRIEAKGLPQVQILPSSSNPELPAPKDTKLLDGPDSE